MFGVVLATFAVCLVCLVVLLTAYGIIEHKDKGDDDDGKHEEE